MWSVLLLTLGGIALSDAAATMPCSVVEATMCFNLPVLMHQLCGQSASEEAQLDIQCRITEQILKCLVAYSEKCTSYVTDFDKKYFEEKKGLLDQLCTNGTDLRQRYLENVQCLRENTVAIYDQCINDNNLKEQAHVAQLGCDTYWVLSECYNELMVEKCGNNTADVVKDMSSALDNLFKDACDNGKVPSVHVITKRSLHADLFNLF